MVAFLVSIIAIVLSVLPSSSHAILIPGADNNHGYKVAVSHSPLTDTSRKDPYRPTENRSVMVSLFMPVPKDSCSKECQVAYMPLQTARIANEQFIVGGQRDIGVFEDIQYSVCCKSSARIDASKIPVVVLEAHVDTSRLLYSTMARFITANGAAVVLVDHPGDTSIVEFPSSTIYNSGTVALSNLSPLTAWNGTVSKALETRTLDIRFVLSQLASPSLLPTQFPSFTFSSALNTTSHGILGHGLGGTVATSFGTSANASSSSTLVSINLSGTPPLLTHRINNPPLFFFGRQDFRRENDIHWPRTWRQLTGQSTEFDLNDSAIFDVSDVPVIVELARNEGGKKNVVARGLSAYAPVQGTHAVTCFVENIVKMKMRLAAQNRDLGDCVRMFEGVVPYPGV
ncbi:hypothetical protein ACJQWK_06786 [Exserohilum turcicum]|uniref:1-alkyl-2-acetylglycerophosphocholine esterase n=1 Tax=Exserohilum turcicum (strain 28A) TaxID=671987 RepID=R0IJT5_EXST2|nr:uncharacterized protein SETTUDRAFT_137519 [Exserohilum turcica Et28A]EOA85121.1 hypothetical protein SETTUDRAFT_137519 [Exserohilum turcica Et28A]